MVSLKFRILRVDEIDPSQFSCVFQMELFIQTTFASPSAWHSFPLFSRCRIGVQLDLCIFGALSPVEMSMLLPLGLRILDAFLILLHERIR